MIFPFPLARHPIPMHPNRRHALTRLLALGASLGPAGSFGHEAAKAATADWSTTASGRAAADLVRTLAARVQAAQAPGLSWALIANGQVVNMGACGHADLATGAPMQPDSLVSTASVTKTFTGALLMREVERGRCVLDEAAERHLPFALRHPLHPQAPMTLRHLLTHTSGLADDGPSYLASYACGDPAEPLGAWLLHALHGEAAQAKPPFHADAPGRRHAYSNVGYGLLGLVLERLHGRPFADVLRAELLDPLGMPLSFMLLRNMPSEAMAQRTLATPYERLDNRNPWPRLVDRLAKGEPLPMPSGGDRQQALCNYGFPTLADGLLRSSAMELSRFALALLHGGELDGRRVLRAETIAQMFSDQLGALPPDARPTRYQQGLTWRGLGEGIWAHFGSDPGTAAALAVRQQDGRGLVMLSNSVGARPLMGQLVMAWMTARV